jgi:glutathione S-transferase
MFLRAVGCRAAAASAAAATVATAARSAAAPSKVQHAEAPPPTFFASWFCPYAQRVWIALEEKRIDYRYVEIDPYEPAEAPGQYTKRSLPLEEKRRRYPDFVAASPRGLVPALACPGDGDAVCDSLVMLEYLEERWPSATPLLPERPAERARVRYWCVYATEKIIPFYYRMLMARDAEGREAARAQVVEGLKGWATACADDGPYFLGARFSTADLFLFPWYERLLTVGAAYRGFEPPSSPEFARLGRWHAAVRARPAVARTLADRAQLVENYSGYADGSATSDVAKRFRVAG